MKMKSGTDLKNDHGYQVLNISGGICTILRNLYNFNPISSQYLWKVSNILLFCINRNQGSEDFN